MQRGGVVVAVDLAAVVTNTMIMLLTVLKSLVGPFLHSLHFASRRRSLRSERPVSIVVATRSGLCRLRRGLRVFLRRGCPTSCRMVIIYRDASNRARSCLGHVTTRGSRLCCACVPRDSHCVDEGGLRVALNIGTTGCR